MQRHPAVALAAAVGMPDEYAGELPVCYVALRPGATVTIAELREHAGARLPSARLAEAPVHRRGDPAHLGGQDLQAQLRCDAAARLVTQLVHDQLGLTAARVVAREGGPRGMTVSVALPAADSGSVARVQQACASTCSRSRSWQRPGTPERPRCSHLPARPAAAARLIRCSQTSNGSQPGAAPRASGPDAAAASTGTTLAIAPVLRARCSHESGVFSKLVASIMLRVPGVFARLPGVRYRIVTHVKEISARARQPLSYRQFPNATQHSWPSRTTHSRKKQRRTGCEEKAGRKAPAPAAEEGRVGQRGPDAAESARVKAESPAGGRSPAAADAAATSPGRSASATHRSAY